MFPRTKILIYLYILFEVFEETNILFPLLEPMSKVNKAENALPTFSESLKGVIKNKCSLFAELLEIGTWSNLIEKVTI